MVLVSGYMECVKLHHIWKLQLHAGVYHLYTMARRFDLYLKCGTLLRMILQVLANEFVPLAIEFVTLAQKFVMTE